MKALSIYLALTAAACAILPGPAAYGQRKQDPEAFYRSPHTMHGKTVVIPTGTTIEGRMDETIGSSVSKPGKRFTISIASPVLANGTDVIIPSGAKILGEVVEAIPHDKIPRKKGAPKPTGKLRVTMNGLQMPDGMTYPLVCSMTGEAMFMGNRVMANPTLGGGVGYMGTAASFEAVSPNLQQNLRRGGRGPQVVDPSKFMKDPIYGAAAAARSAMNRAGAKPLIRALVMRDRELYIDEGSSISVKLDAPLKIGINPTGTAGEALPELDTGSSGGLPEGESSGRRFARTRAPEQRSQPAGESPGDITDSDSPSGTAGDGGGQVPFPPAGGSGAGQGSPLSDDSF